MSGPQTSIPPVWDNSPARAGHVKRSVRVRDTIDPSDVVDADSPWAVIDKYPDLRMIFWPSTSPDEPDLTKHDRRSTPTSGRQTDGGQVGGAVDGA